MLHRVQFETHALAFSGIWQRCPCRKTQTKSFYVFFEYKNLCENKNLWDCLVVIVHTFCNPLKYILDHVKPKLLAFNIAFLPRASWHLWPCKSGLCDRGKVSDTKSRYILSVICFLYIYTPVLEERWSQTPCRQSSVIERIKGPGRGGGQQHKSSPRIGYNQRTNLLVVCTAPFIHNLSLREPCITKINMITQNIYPRMNTGLSGKKHNFAWFRAGTWTWVP